MTRNAPAALLAIFAIGVIGGCGPSGPERVVVSGNVTYRGQPIPKGFIRFVPIDDTSGAPAGASITEGKYEVTNKGGVLVGKHRVEITAVRPRSDPAGRDLAAMEGAGIQYLPPKYNTQTELRVDIPSGGPITKDFPLN
jgi:hypothetical protein